VSKRHETVTSESSRETLYFTGWSVTCVCLCVCLSVCVCRYDYGLVFGVDVHGLSKAERLLYSESLMTHAMVLTAVHEEVMSHRLTVSVCLSVTLAVM